MPREYKIQFDMPYTELEEIGFFRRRLFSKSDLEHSPFDAGGNVWLEPNTGTMFLRPIQTDPDMWNEKYDDYALPLTSFDHAVDGTGARHLWAEYPIPGWPTQKMMRTQTAPKTLLNTLILVAEAVVSLEGGITWAPILKSYEVYPINQGFSVDIEINRPISDATKNLIGFEFGRFFLAIGTLGHATLYWKGTGSTWTQVKQFGGLPRFVDKGQSLISSTPVPYGRMRILIVPMGRKHIWVAIKSASGWWGGVYTHQDAVWAGDENRYWITEAGAFGVYIAPTESGNFGIAVSKIGYYESAVWHEDVELPYGPTVTPEMTPFWLRTTGEPEVIADTLNASGLGPFIPDGSRTISPRLIMSGDGTCSPFVDGYHLKFDPKYRLYDHGQWDLPDKHLQRISLSDGIDLDDQRASLTLHVNNDDDEKVRGLISRPRVDGQLMVDGVRRGIWRFESPKTVLRPYPQKCEIEMTGKSLFASRLASKRFFFPPSYNGWTHPDVVSNLLQLSGFPASEIVVQAENVKLPETTSETGGDATEAESRTQPAFNSPVQAFLDYVIENYSGWPLRVDCPNLKWQYQAVEFPTAAEVSFYRLTDCTNQRRPTADGYWYEPQVSKQIIPPEANVIWLFGQTDDGEAIANYFVDYDSIHFAGDPKPNNFMGGMVPVIIIDLMLNTQEVLDRVLTKIGDNISRSIEVYTWKGPYVPELTPYMGVELSGLSDVLMLESVSTEAGSPHQLENYASTTYVAKRYL